MTNKIKYVSLFLTATLVFVTFSYSAAYAVKIIPPRLVIGADAKTEHIFIKNNANKTEVFRFSWKHMAMDKEGNVLNLDKLGLDKAPAGYNSLEKIVRFSPRRAVLKPGQTQRVTFMLRRSSDLPAGEYRSHFLVEREPQNISKPSVTKQEAEGSNAQNPSKAAGANLPKSPSVAFDVLVSRAGPIYVLNGETNAKLSVLSAEIKRNTQRNNQQQPANLLHFKVQKTGNRSVIGVAKAFCTSEGKEVVISKSSKLFAVYAEGEFRNEKMGVQIPPKGCSAYRIAIKAHPDDVLAGQLLAEKRF